jgi:hypothetical protein
MIVYRVQPTDFWQGRQRPAAVFRRAVARSPGRSRYSFSRLGVRTAKLGRLTVRPYRSLCRAPPSSEPDARR